MTATTFGWWSAKGGAKSWIFKGTLYGKPIERGIGSVKTVTLAEARKKATQMWIDVSNGIDPKKPKPKPIETFGTFAERCTVEWPEDWRGKTVSGWRQTFRDYASSLMKLPLDRIETEHVLTGAS